MFADLHAEKRTRWYAVSAVLMLAVGIAAGVFIPVSRHRMSLSFVLIVASSSALVFLFFHGTGNWFGTRGQLLAPWGANPLALYIAHFFLLAVFLVPPVPWWHFGAPLWLAAVQGAAFVAMLHAFAAWMRRRGLFISL